MAKVAAGRDELCVFAPKFAELIDFAAKEQDQSARPVLTSHIENLDDYDVIFVGYPN